MTLWYTARGAGLSALVLLTVATCLGALVSRRGDPARRYLVQYLHRACAGLGLTALAVHVTTIVLDSYSNVSWGGALVPFTAGYRATWVGLGTVAIYTFLLVSVLGLARGRMAASPRAARTWRAVHRLAYVGWLSAMLHGFTSGTDSSVGWVGALYLLCLVAVAASVAARIAAARSPRLGLGPAAGVSTAFHPATGPTPQGGVR